MSYTVKWTTANAVAFEDSSNTSWEDIDLVSKEEFDAFVTSSALDLDAISCVKINADTWVVEFPTVDRDGEDIMETMWAHLEEKVYV